jgi:hypothetical protein
MIVIIDFVRLEDIYSGKISRRFRGPIEACAGNHGKTRKAQTDCTTSNANITPMIAVCPHCNDSVSIYFDEKTLSATLVPVWHYSRPDNHHWKLDKESSASLREEYTKAQARSKQKTKPVSRPR